MRLLPAIIAVFALLCVAPAAVATTFSEMDQTGQGATSPLAANEHPIILVQKGLARQRFKSNAGRRGKVKPEGRVRLKTGRARPRVSDARGRLERFSKGQLKAVSAAAQKLSAATKRVARHLARSGPTNQKLSSSKLRLRQARIVVSKWSKGTRRSRSDSIRFHAHKHGNGRSILQYTKDALKLYREHKTAARPHALYDGTMGIKIKSPDGRFGIYTTQGNIVTFGYK